MMSILMNSGASTHIHSSTVHPSLYVEPYLHYLMVRLFPE